MNCISGVANMTGSTLYAMQKTREAVNFLATQEFSLRKRLFDAVTALHPLKADKIPHASLHGKLEQAIAKAYENATRGDHELSHLTNDDVSTTAREIVELFESCVALHAKKSATA